MSEDSRTFIQNMLYIPVSRAAQGISMACQGSDGKIYQHADSICMTCGKQGIHCHTMPSRSAEMICSICGRRNDVCRATGDCSAFTESNAEAIAEAGEVT